MAQRSSEVAAEGAPRHARRKRSPGPRPPSIGAFDAGIRLLARRPFAAVELSRRLRRLGHAEDEVSSALVRLQERGYIDDATYAAAHVRRRSGGRGPRALAAELSARGVDRDVVRQAVGGYDQDAQMDAAVRLVERTVGGRKPASYERLLATAGARLLRRGFSSAVARAACSAVWSGSRGAPGA